MEANSLSENKVGFFNTAAVFLITFYQKVISPFKGFSCAHRYQYGGFSCSEFIKQVILRKGIVSGYSDIRSRFRACRSAAANIQKNYPHHEAGFLDCGLDGCGDIGSCFDGGGADGGSGGKSSAVNVLPVSLLIIIFFIGGFVWFKSSQVKAIEIRLIETQQEVQEEGIARLIGGERPDYQVVFLVNGSKIATNTLNNSSAENWLSLMPKSGFEIEDIQKITILNKQVLKDKVLEVFESPGQQGNGEFYEYRIIEN